MEIRDKDQKYMTKTKTKIVSPRLL